MRSRAANGRVKFAEGLGSVDVVSKRIQDRAHLAAVVSGRVQGVGFRYFVHQQARKLGLSGWVINQPDGTVALEADGHKEALEKLAESLQQGPADAVVEDVQISWGSDLGWSHGFEVRR